MEQDIDDSCFDDGAFGSCSSQSTGTENVTLIISALQTLIEGVKALSVIRMIYQISVTADDRERELLEMSLRQLVAIVYNMRG